MIANRLYNHYYDLSIPFYHFYDIFFNMIKLAERLKELRQEKGISQKNLAQQIGIAQSAYHYYETGKQEPTASIIIKLADYFEVCTDYLLGRQDWY